MRKTFWGVVVLLMSLVTASSAVTPKVTLSTTRIATPGHVIVLGSGFTPSASISSHLVRPDGAEYPVLALYTNNKGEFTHDIETLVLTLGVHKLWVVDDTSKVVSNHAEFEVTSNPVKTY